MGRAEFLADSDKIDSAKYNLVVAVEAAIDICNHIAAKVGGRAPTADLKRYLEEIGEYIGSEL